MIIHNKIENERWRSVPCHCLHNGNPEHDHPMKTCTHCKAEICFNSIPKESFWVSDEQYDKDGKIINVSKKEILSITLVNCESTQMCLGWIF
jgi:hypothetical protein